MKIRDRETGLENTDVSVDQGLVGLDLPGPETTEDLTTEVDPWGAAMAEQSSAEEDPWGSAMAEQDAADKAVKPTAAAFPDFGKPVISLNTKNDIEYILDIPVQLTVELGRTKISIRNLLQLAQGSVVELVGLAGEPMDVLVNNCLIAQGEVVVVNDKFGIRLTDIITPAERIKKMNK
jgi:flagellar motor switch protein FliN/FliY